MAERLGDHLHVHAPEGKGIAITLMALGIAVFGLVSATLASLFVENDTKDDYEEIRDQLLRVEAKLDALLSMGGDSVEQATHSGGPFS